MPTKRERKAFVATSVPLWRVRTLLKKQGLFAAIDAAIESEKDSKPAIWEAWNHGYIVSRDDRLVKKLNLSAAQIDALLTESSKSE